MVELTVEDKVLCWDKFEELVQQFSKGDSSGNRLMYCLMLEMLIREIKAQVIIDEGN